MKTSEELLGAHIKEIRKSHGLSQERLAELVDIEPSPTGLIREALGVR